MQGWLTINKAAGISSFKALSIIKRLVKPFKVGHAGTLDPFATGMLLVGIGKATKLMSYAIGKDKGYYFSIRFGEDRDSLDIDGQVTATSDLMPTKEEVALILPKFIGNLEQMPPIYSAIKIKGKRACDRVRNGENVVLQPRSVICYKLELIEVFEKEMKFYVECSSGFYVRSIARDIIKALGTCGHVSKLHRSKIGPFLEKEIISLDYLEKIVHNGDRNAFEQLLKPIDCVLDDILVYDVSQENAKKIRMGQKIPIQDTGSKKVLAKLNGEAVALCDIEANVLSPRKVF